MSRISIEASPISSFPLTNRWILAKSGLTSINGGPDGLAQEAKRRKQFKRALLFERKRFLQDAFESGIEDPGGD